MSGADPNHDLAAARAEAEARYAANRHSSDSESDHFASDDERREKRKIKRSKVLKRHAEQDAPWHKPPYDYKRSAYGLFADDFRRDHPGPCDPHTAWRQLATVERERYEDIARPYESEHALAMAAYYDQIPLSPSVHPSVPASPEDSEIDNSSSIDFDYEDDKENRETIRRDFAGIQCWARYRKDYIKPSQAVVVEGHFLNFFKLPVEIRHKIFCLLLRTGKALEQMPEDQSYENYDKTPFDTRLFAVNRQFLAEGPPAFYGQNTFLINVYENQALPLWIRNASPHHSMDGVRRVHIWIFFVTKESSADMGPRLRSIFTVLASLKLAFLRITPVCQNSWYNVELDKVFDEMLAPAEMIQGVNEVIFTNRDSMREAYALYEHQPVGTEQTRSRLRESMMSPKLT